MSFKATTTRRTPRYVGWGFSKLKNWRNCPKRHLEVDIEKKWGQGEQSDALEFGNAVHKAMENRIMKGTPIPVHLQAELKGSMEAWCHRVLGGFKDAADFQTQTGGILIGEQQLAMGEDFQECGWFDKTTNVWLRAKIDVTKIQGPVAFLPDWKTGNISDRESEQLAISAAMIFAKYPQVQVVRTKFVWLKEDAETTLDIKREQMPEFWAGILPEVNAYRAAVTNMDMPAKPSGLCGWCPVHTCSHHPDYRG